MNNKIKKIFSILLCAVMIFSLFSVTGIAENVQKSKIKLEVIEQQFSCGDTVSVLVSVENVSELSSMDCDVFFDDQMLSFSDIKKSENFSGTSPNWNYWDAGHAQFDCSFSKKFSGTTDVAVIIFQAISDGEASVSININDWQGKNQPDNITFSFVIGGSSAGTVKNKGLTYELSDGCATVTDCDESIEGALVIPSAVNGCSVTAIGESAFFSCNKITSVTIPDSVTSISANALTNCAALEKIIVDKNNQNYSSDDRGALFDKSKSKIIRYPIGSSATEYIIPDGVITICESAFAHAENLKSITIPKTVTTIEPVAFLSTWKLEGIVIPENVTEISGNAFSCSGIKWVVVPEGITKIEPRTFDCCSSLEKIYLPASLTYVDAFAFSMCKNLTDVYYAGSESDWKNVKISDMQNSDLINANIYYDSDSFIPFDVDGNGKVNAADARLALRAASRLEILEGNYFNAADIDRDGKITPTDARKILRKAAGLD